MPKFSADLPNGILLHLQALVWNDWNALLLNRIILFGFVAYCM